MDTKVRETLDRLHAQAFADLPNIARGFLRSLGGRLQPEHMKDAFIAVGRNEGTLLYNLARGTLAKNIVEYGTSFGISAIYLGAAARENGGRVVTTEILTNKAEKAGDHISQAGLDDIVTVLEGDALETLADHEGPIDLLFLDAWSELYVPLMNLLGPRMRDGALIVVDNTNHRGTTKFLKLLERTPHISVSPLGRMALACYTGRWADI